MTRLDLIPLDACQSWSDALADVPHGFHHTQDFAHAMHMTTGYHTFLLSIANGGARLLCPLIEREFAGYRDVATPSGLSGFIATGPWSLFEDAWNDFVVKRCYVSGYIGLHPLFTPDGLDNCPSHNTVYVLDLAQGEECLLRGMDQNRRRELRGWDKRSPNLVHDTEELAYFLRSEYAAFMRQVGAPAPHFSTEALDLLCHSSSSLVVGVRTGEGLGAIHLFGVTPYAAESLINIATEPGPHRTDLLWYGISQLAERDVPVLNLGGGTTEDDNVAKAKQRFGPRPLPLRSLRQRYRNDVYLELCGRAGVDSETGRFFPAYRSRQTAEEAPT